MRLLNWMSIICGALLAAAFAQPPKPILGENEQPLLPRPAFLRVLGASQLSLFADYYWLRTLNQIGSATSAAQYQTAYHFAEMATELDPLFRQAYLFTAIAIPIQSSRGQYANADLSTRLLRKGLLVFPDDYQLKFQLAYNLAFFHRQHREAAEVLTQLVSRPEAPGWLGALATRLYAQAGNFDAGEALTRALLDAADDEESRQFYRLRLLEIAQEQALRTLDAAIARYRERTGTAPGSLYTLIGSGDLLQIPPDPLNGTFFIHADGRARSTASRYRLELIQDAKLAEASQPSPTP